MPGARPSLDRWSAGAWLLVRAGGTTIGGFNGGQLGGDQAGLRIAYAITRRAALIGRVTAPLKGIGREAAFGLEWQPTRLPLRLVAEYRAALDRGHGGPAAGVIAGTGPAPLAFGFDLATYGQAGAVHRQRLEPFADGAVRLSRIIAARRKIHIDAGVGIWGGAQRDAQRLDIGPTLGATIPIGGRNVRLSLDWRARIAGRARPGSGLALTLGSDF